MMKLVAFKTMFKRVYLCIEHYVIIAKNLEKINNQIPVCCSLVYCGDVVST